MRQTISDMASGTKVAIVLIFLALVFWLGIGIAALVAPDNPSSRNPPAGSNMPSGL